MSYGQYHLFSLSFILSISVSIRLPQFQRRMSLINFNQARLDEFNHVDLSHSLNDHTICWPNGESFSLCLECSVSPDGSFYASGNFQCAEHCGTHVDAPYHFNQKGITVDLLPLDTLMSDVFVIDIVAKCEDPNYILTSQDIIDFESFHGVLPKGTIVLIRTGWSRFYAQGAKAYLGFDSSIDGPYDVNSSTLSFPGIGVEAANLLVERKVAAVGLDTGNT